MTSKVQTTETPDPRALYRKRRQGVALAALLACVLFVLGFFLITPPGAFKPLQLIQLLRDAGPWIFFGAMAFLPVVGFPIAPFNLAAGPAFAPSLGLVPVLLSALSALAINVSLTYLLARYSLRPLVLKLASWLGYSIPEIPADKQLAAAFLVRATPGPPFFLQSCLLGLTRIPFLTYMIASCTVAGAYTTLCIIGGDALMTRNNRLALLAFGLLGAIALLLKLLRKPSRPKAN